MARKIEHVMSSIRRRLELSTAMELATHTKEPLPPLPSAQKMSDAFRKARMAERLGLPDAEDAQEAWREEMHKATLYVRTRRARYGRDL